ncbi:LamG-like jellyroll fold domain-containing protein [Amycolatopsis aidingensis]|uniref:LamG-like jellyroll fold domain-containing protein n=1 Tax=Amycolatopsis aidingensis TaxID=2842453 RepID=UPI001C0D8322|nr:LamG-like jellyroll fold domain-containing protein [Amycolatopsis aidingensis]
MSRRAGARGWTLRSLSVLALSAVWMTSMHAVPAAAEAPAAEPITAAADEATALAAAQEQGSRVEVTRHTSETAKVFANPEGDLTLEQSVMPERVRRDGEWVDADTTLERRADGTIAAKASPIEVSFSAGGDAALATIVNGGKELALGWPEQLPEPVLSGDSATYPEVMSGVDLRVRATLRGFAHELVVKTPEAAANPELHEIDFDLRTEGVRLSADEAGNIKAVDQAGATVFHAPAPRMWDSSGTEQVGASTRAAAEPRPKDAAVGVRIGSDSVSLMPDKELLTDQNATFPLVIDPDFSAITPEKSAWTLVRRSHRNDSHWNLTPRDDDERYKGVARVGHAPGWPSEYLDRSIFRFPMGVLRGARIKSAEFQIYQVWKYSHTCDPNQVPRMYLHLTDPIGPGTTWNNQPAWHRHLSSSRSTAKAGQSCGPTWIGMDAQSAVQEGADVGWGDIHLGIKASYGDEGNNNDAAWKRFHVKQENGVRFFPKLSVTFNRKPNAPHWVGTNPTLPDPCRWCAGKRYYGGDQITLQGRLSDPDGGQLRANWTATMQPSGQTIHREQWLASGSTYGTPLDVSDKHGQTVNWSVHGYDGALGGPSANGPSFTVDRQAPDAQPGVSGRLYQEDNAWHGGVGVPDEFTFTSSGVSDVDHYLYGFTDPPTTKVDADELGGNAKVVIEPPTDGPVDLYVQSVDRAGLRSPMRVYHFYVRAGNGAASHWSLDGDAADDAFLGDRDGTVNGGATWGPGAVGAGIQLDGIDDDVSAPNTVRTDASFSVAAWVRPDELDRGFPTAVSQDGNHLSGFLLQATEDNRWRFTLPGSDAEVNNSGAYVVSAQYARVGEWTHLAGVYDAFDGTASLYVNGVLAAEVEYQDHWNADGPVRIGRAKWFGAPAEKWLGAVDEVGIYDRALSDLEIHGLVSKDNVQVGHWKLDENEGSTARNAVAGGDAGILANGAVFTSDGALDGAVQLDGVDDQVLTNGPAVRTDQSFSVAGWLKADALAPDGGALTAISQDGEANSGFLLQQRGTGWMFGALEETGGGWAGYAWSPSGTAQAGTWTHVAGVFDAPAQELTIYVNGEAMATAPVSSAWNSTGKFVIGRAKLAGAPVDHWPGAVDEVRAYSRALGETEIQGIVRQDDVVAASWKLDGNAQNSVDADLHGTLHNYPSWTEGQSDDPNPGDLAVQLDGNSEYISAPIAVDSSQSFSVAAWVKLDELPSRWASVVSQNGTHTSAFNLAYSSEGRFALAMHGPDATHPSAITQVHSEQSAQVGAWTHLTAVYDAPAQKIRLYVNGTLNGTGHFADAWKATGELNIGRARWQDNWIDFLPGSVDDVKLYSRALFADEVRLQAGRDLSLIHNHKLDESSGDQAADAIGGRTGTLHNGAEFTEGRTGNAVSLDGVDDHVSTTGVDLRTDTSFTVSAWVYLDEKDGQVTAVSVDGNRASKFRLGHVLDGENRLGSWVFEMPESDTADAPVTAAALSTLRTELDTWVHLAGVYDAAAKKVWLYVNGTRIGDGTLQNTWNADGGLKIGRGKDDGSPAEFWPGQVDDVRLYTGGLTDDRIKALYDSYTDPANPTVPSFGEESVLRAPDASNADVVYAVIGGARVGFDTPQEFYDTGHTVEEIMLVPWSTLKLLPAKIPDGTVLRAPDAPGGHESNPEGVLVVAGGAQVWFHNSQEMYDSGYDGDDVRLVPWRVVDAMPKIIGDGTMVKAPNSDRIWRIEGGQRTEVAEGEQVQVIPARELDEYPVATA